MRKPKFQNIAGMPDVLPKDQLYYDFIEKASFKISSYYGYQRVETPILENVELFEKGTGLSTDIVQKQMYNLQTKGGDKLTLRPEFTPSIARMYIQHGMSSWTQPVKISEMGQLFRHERQQAGRYRQFHQFEIDAIGDAGGTADAQIILIFCEIFKSIGIKDVEIRINSIGCSKCRPNYKRTLRDYYRGRERSLCKDCRARKKANILRLLDCKDEKCERLKISAPEIIDHLCAECHSHLKGVLEILDYLEMPYVLSPQLVRGLDYYTKTVFEIFSGASQKKNDENKKEDEEKELRKSALAGGGRFDGLIGLLGGEDTPAVGGSIGIERAISLLKERGSKIPERKNPQIFFVHLGEFAKKKGLKLIEEFRSSGILVREALGKSSIKSQMSIADKMGVDYVLIVGHQEVAEDTLIMRDMKAGSQEVIPAHRIIKEIKKRLNKKKK